MLRSDLCEYSDFYIVLKGRINVTGTENATKRKKKITLAGCLIKTILLSR